MLFRYLIKCMKRSAFLNALFCLLLILAGALFTLSSGLWYSVFKTEQSLDEIITTIALPDQLAIRRQVRSIYDGGRHDYYYPEQIQYEIMNEISEKIYDSGLFKMDDRRIYGAYVEGIRSVAFRLAEEADYRMFLENSPQTAAAFVVKCTETMGSFKLGYGFESIDRAYIGFFEVEQEIYLHHGRSQMRTLAAYFPASNPDGSPPVTEGKRYIISGHGLAQGDRGPSWYDYWSFPSNITFPSALLVSPVSRISDFEIVDSFDAFHELPTDLGIFFTTSLGMQNVAEVFPLDIREVIPKVDDALGHEGVAWFEIEGSLEEALASERGEEIQTALDVVRISYNSLQVLTTNDVNSIFRFNQRVNRIDEGRTFSRADYETSARVCLISRQLADENGLSAGDKLDLQLYNANLQYIPTSEIESAWTPSLYHPSLPLTEPIEYEIIGVYSGLTQEMRDHSVSPNTVIIPASSFDENPEGNPMVRTMYAFSPPLLNTIIIPNGETEEAKAKIDELVEGYSGFFRYYDQGYARLVPILENLRFGMSWILGLSAISWFVALMMFSLFYTGRRIKEMSLLYGLGVSKAKCFLWVFAQCAVIIIIANIIVVSALLPVYENILESALYISSEFTEVYRNFILSDMNVAGGIRFTLPLDRTLLGLIAAVVGCTVVLLTVSSVIILRATKNRWKSRQGVE